MNHKKFIWNTKDGRRIQITEMDDFHLKNSYNWLSERIEGWEKKGTKVPQYWRIAWECLRAELSDRGLYENAIWGDENISLET
jgi:hypothetical protein